MKRKKPKQRVYRKLSPGFASDYIQRLRLLSRKHKTDNSEEVRSILRVLNSMSGESFYAGRGEVWIPVPNPRTGYYPIIEKVPYTMVRRAIRSNTSEAVRAKAWGAVASSVEPFLPLFARRPGSLTEAQRRSLLAHAIVALPFVKGRHPALLGKRVPGELGVSDIGTRSIIPVRRMSPEDWEKGFTMKKFSFSEDLSKSIKRQLTRKPRVPNPTPHMPKASLKDMLKRATDLKVKLEPQRRDYDWASKLEGRRKELRKRLPLMKRDWLERRLMGKPNITIAAARSLAAKHVPTGTEVHIKRKLPAMYHPRAKTVTTPPHAPSVVHEAAHARQHKKLGKAYIPIRAAAAGLGSGAAVALALARGLRVGRLRHLPRWVAPAAAMAGDVPALAGESHAAAKAWKTKGGKRAAAGTLGTYFPVSVLTSLLLASGVGGAGKLLRKRKAVQLRTVRRMVQKKMALGRYVLSDTDRMYYEDGVREWLREAKRKTGRAWKGAVRWMKREALPAVARNITLAEAGLAHTELGLAPTTVDLVPVQRIGLKRDLQPYPSVQLRKVVQSLQENLVSEVDPVLRKGLEKGVSEIATELMIRKAIPGYLGR